MLPLGGYAHSKLNFSFRLYFSLLPSYFCLMPKCPTCGKPAEWQDNPWRPFCSERCKLIDFSRWANEEYRVPGKEINPDEITDRSEKSESTPAEDTEG
jgi:endogenous inhibitor of DNA gyrase (YacG/DUF329 family)